MAKRVSLSPADAAEWLEALSPVEIKTRLVDYLLWQDAHGKRLLHSAHYFRLVHYGARPRETTIRRGMVQVRQLTQEIGKAV